MRTLLHVPLDPHCRKVRLLLAEKGLAARLVEAAPWLDHPDLGAHNPALTVPVLIDEPPTGGEVSISPASAIMEYVEEAYPEPALMPATSAARAEVRRIAAWFDVHVEADVNARLVGDRIRGGAYARRLIPHDTRTEALAALAWRLDYVTWLLEQRTWLAGTRLTLADLTAAAHLSTLDYLGLVPWRDFPDLKLWYARLKSRPSFRTLLADRLEGAAPSPHYDNPDF